ncbi:glycosyltransferase [Metabacillus sp. GX 13764]|uniref:glycosyltransferase n=1 Tax=Metabacillus kandeliae TaxID=2900151 RepID=UPI001E643E87|nr:glycosyltransferase [Metabacillus kandeliae]MCD7034068.1 glycosyltransferase [Metabacillus kandeliae]
MVTISLCMIVKNEEDSLGRCLESVRDIADEINIIDTGSTDKTKEIAGKYTKRIFDFKWVDDFAKARNFAFTKATKEYILWLDADDVFLESDREKFKKLKKTLDPAYDSVTMEYHLAFDDHGNVTSSLRRNRLVKRNRQFQWIGAVHEYLEVFGNIFNSDIAVSHKSIHHDSDRNLRIYENRLKQGEVFSPRDLYYFANELKDHRKFKRAAEKYEEFLKTGQGWVEDNIGACSKLADCYEVLSDKDKSIQSVLRTFLYDVPRPEACFRLGYYLFEKGLFHQAINWYKLAIESEVPSSNWGFQNRAYSTWLPHIQLCVCYDRIGDYEKANFHNEEAGKFRPNDANYLHNKAYLEGLLKGK